MKKTVPHPQPESNPSHSADLEGPRPSQCSIVTGNTFSSRPTKRAPLGCDCCNKCISYLDASHTHARFPFGDLPFAICHECSAKYPAGETPELRIRWILTRASRFGQ